MPLRDIITRNPRILFVGINPSLRSEQVGHHFASPGNPFWKLLYASKLIPEPLTCDDDKRLVEFGMAMTNLCARASRSAAELTREEVAAGKGILAKKIKRIDPEVVAFVGLSIYRDFFGKTASPGAGAKVEVISGARVFVLPNPSGLNASFPGFKHKLIWFEKLREFIEAQENGKRAS
jgi:TDG/mug DNA glycosylase family protein